MRLSELTAIGLVPQRMAASVAGTLGLVGLLLCAIGIYGVTSYRSRSARVRSAFASRSAPIVATCYAVLRQGLVLAAIGTAVGVVMAAVGSTFLESLLFGVHGLDPVTFGSACALFVVVTLLASYFPALRATKVDPMVALRTE